MGGLPWLLHLSLLVAFVFRRGGAKWAEEAWKKAQEYNKAMDKLQDQYRDLGRLQQDTIAKFHEMLALQKEWAEIVKGALAGLTGGETEQETTSPPRTGRGRQLGGYVEQNETTYLHGGEYVVPRSGQLVLKESDKSVGLLGDIYGVLLRIAIAAEHGEQTTVIVQTPNAERAKEHILSMEDFSHTLLK
jgi:hypothetical protein